MGIIDYCKGNDIFHEFLPPRNPQENRLGERKNRTLQEMQRVMLNNKNLSMYF